MKNPVVYRVWVRLNCGGKWIHIYWTEDKQDALEDAAKHANRDYVEGVQITGTDQCTYQQVYAQVVK